MMNNNSCNFTNFYKINTTKSKFDSTIWIAFDLEWRIIKPHKTVKYGLDKNASGTSKHPVLEKDGEILTFAFEDNSGIKGCFDITEFDSPKSFLEAIIDKLLQYKYCFAWGSKAIERRNVKTGKLEGFNGDLATLDQNLKANGIPTIVKYNEFSGMPYIRRYNYQGNNHQFIADMDLLKVFAKPYVKSKFKNRYKSLHLEEVRDSLLGYGKIDNKTGAIVYEMSIDERKTYCLQDAHVVAELVRIRNGDILKMMQVIASHTGLAFEDVCHKGMMGMWKKILNDEIQKKIRLCGYDRLPSTLRKLYSKKSSFVEDIDIYDEDEDDEDNELSEYKENSYEQYTELVEQKLKERSSNESIDNSPINIYLNGKGKSNNTTKQDSVIKYKGGMVLKPKRGLHYDVYVFDVTSLYPTIIINNNISPETVNCSCCKNNVISKISLDKDILKDLKYIKEKDKCIWTCQLKKGLFSKKLQELTEIRIKYKNDGKELESAAIKAMINSGYGVFGNIHFKYYDPRCAELITALGRQTLSEMQKIANEMDFTILYGDTDSLFVNNVKSKENVSRFIGECRRKLNVEVSHEKTFRKLILVGKKHYVGFPNDRTKEPIIKGMEGIKSDRPEIVQSTFRQLIEDIGNDKDPVHNLKHSINELNRRQVPKERLAISLVLNKDPHDYANDNKQKRLGIKKGLQKGSTLVYYKCDKQEIIVDATGKQRTKTVSESDDPADISYVKYKEMLLNVVKDTIEILGYNIEQDLLPKKKMADSYLSQDN